MRRLARWLETLTGWWNEARLPLGHSRVPKWLGDDPEAVRTQPRGPSQDEIDEANYQNSLNFLELKHAPAPALVVRYRCPECGYTYATRSADPVPFFGCPNDGATLEVEA